MRTRYSGKIGAKFEINLTNDFRITVTQAPFFLLDILGLKGIWFFLLFVYLHLIIFSFIRA